MIKRFLIMFYIFIVYFCPRSVPNYGIICYHAHFRFFQLSCFESFLIYRCLWNTTEFRFSFNKWVINGMKISSVSEAAKLITSIWECTKITHTKIKQMPPERKPPTFPKLRYFTWIWGYCYYNLHTDVFLEMYASAHVQEYS